MMSGGKRLLTEAEVLRVYISPGFKTREYSHGGDGEEDSSPSPP